MSESPSTKRKAEESQTQETTKQPKVEPSLCKKCWDLGNEEHDVCPPKKQTIKSFVDASFQALLDDFENTDLDKKHMILCVKAWLEENDVDPQ